MSGKTTRAKRIHFESLEILNRAIYVPGRRPIMTAYMTGNLRRWWDSLETLLLTETDSLGVYWDKAGLTLAIVRRGRGRFQVREVAQLPFPAGNPTEDLTPVLRERVAAFGLNGCPVSLAVDSHLAFLRQITLPRAAAENLAQVVAYELDRFVPLTPDQVYYAFQIQETTDTGINLIIMALPRDRVAPCLNLLSKADLRPVGLTLAPLAAANAFAMLGAKRLPPSWLMLHANKGALELTHIDNGVVKSFKQAREPESQSFWSELAAGIDTLEAAGVAPRVLCIYGPGSEDLPVKNLQKRQLDIIYPGQIGLAPSPPAAGQDKALPAVGAALSCLAKPLLKMNLLPPEERATVKVASLSATMTLLVVFLSLLVIWAGSALVHQRVRLYQVNREIARLTPETNEVEKLLTESRNLAKQMEGMRQVGQGMDSLQILKKLTQLIPDNTSLFNLRLSKENLEIGGMSQSASELIPLLEKSGWLTKTEFASPIVTDASKLDHFKITAKVKGLAPTPGKAVTRASTPGLAPHGRTGAAAALPGGGESPPEPVGQLEPGVGAAEPDSGQVPGPGGQ